MNLEGWTIDALKELKNQIDEIIEERKKREIEIALIDFKKAFNRLMNLGGVYMDVTDDIGETACHIDDFNCFTIYNGKGQSYITSYGEQ